MSQPIKWIILLVLAITWGSSFFLIKKGLMAFSPYQVGGLRILLAALTLLILSFNQLKSIPKKHFKWIVLCGLLGNFFPLFLFPIAEEKVASGVAGVLNALVPLFTLIIGVSIFKDHASKKQFFGVFLGFLGSILLIFLPHYLSSETSYENQQTSIYHALLIVLATIMYAFNALIIKHKLSSINPLALTTALFVFVAPFSLIVLIYTGFFSEIIFNSEQNKSLIFIILLAVVGTAFAMILFNKLMQYASAVFVSSVTYIMPIVALSWGFLDGETITWFHILCFSIIILGVVMINKGKKIK